MIDVKEARQSFDGRRYGMKYCATNMNLMEKQSITNFQLQQAFSLICNLFNIGAKWGESPKGKHSSRKFQRYLIFAEKNGIVHFYKTSLTIDLDNVSVAGNNRL